MVTRLFPLGVKVSFEDRSYKLGETINLAVELSPKRDMEVREGRVDLVCEERWTDRSTVMVPQPIRGSRGGVVVAGPMVPKQVTEHHRESYVHTSVVFAKDAQLRSGATTRYSPGMDIGTERPAHAEKATVIWRLRTTVDLAGARDITARRSVKVALV